jgi:hypothetical protein
MVPFFLLSDRAEAWRSSGGVYPPEDPKVSAKPKVVLNTEGVGGETGVFTARFRRVATLVAPQPWFHFFLLSDRAEAWRSSGGVYPPEDPKVSAKPKVVVNTECVGGETGVFTARFRRVATLVAPQPWFHFFLLSDRAEAWRSSGGVYPPEDPKVSAKPKVGVNTEGAGGEPGVFTARFRRVAVIGLV